MSRYLVAVFIATLISVATAQKPGGPYGERKRFDFFVHQLLGVEPPSRNETPVVAEGATR